MPPETAAEREWKTGYDAKQAEIGAYSRLQETKPSSLAYATVDNPVGQLAWIVERGVPGWSEGVHWCPIDQVAARG